MYGGGNGVDDDGGKSQEASGSEAGPADGLARLGRSRRRRRADGELLNGGQMAEGGGGGAVTVGGEISRGEARASSHTGITPGGATVFP